MTELQVGTNATNNISYVGNFVVRGLTVSGAAATAVMYLAFSHPIDVADVTITSDVSSIRLWQFSSFSIFYLNCCSPPP